MIGVMMMLAAESATFLEGQDLYGLCKGGKAEQLECLRYVEGVADGIAVAQGADRRNVRDVCVPPKTTIKKLAGVTVKFMKKYPAEQQLPGSVIVWKALKKAFPCAR